MQTTTETLQYLKKYGLEKEFLKIATNDCTSFNQLMDKLVEKMGKQLDHLSNIIELFDYIKLHYTVVICYYDDSRIDELKKLENSFCVHDPETDEYRFYFCTSPKFQRSKDIYNFYKNNK